MLDDKLGALLQSVWLKCKVGQKKTPLSVQKCGGAHTIALLSLVCLQAGDYNEAYSCDSRLDHDLNWWLHFISSLLCLSWNCCLPQDRRSRSVGAGGTSLLAGVTPVCSVEYVLMERRKTWCERTLSSFALTAQDVTHNTDRITQNVMPHCLGKARTTEAQIINTFFGSGLTPQISKTYDNSLFF